MTRRNSRYADLAIEIRYNLSQGRHPPGTKLPTVQELADTHHVSRKTVGKALKLLSEEHIIDIIPGRGCYTPGPRDDKPKDLIENHLYATTGPRDQIPTTDELAHTVGVSHSCIRRTIANLIRAGILTRRRGRIYRT